MKAYKPVSALMVARLITRIEELASRTSDPERRKKYEQHLVNLRVVFRMKFLLPKRL